MDTLNESAQFHLAQRETAKPEPGRPYLLRLAFGLRAPRVRIRGLDLAGVVEAVGRLGQGHARGKSVIRVP